MMLRYIRSATHLGIVGICLFVLFQAVNMAGFLIARSWQGDLDKVYSYIDASPVRVEARIASADLETPVKTKADAGVRAFVLGQVVAEAPAMTLYWRHLSSMRWSDGDSPERIVAPLAMAHVMGPNEGYMMGARIPIELVMWAHLPPEGRASAANDMIIGGHYFTHEQRIQFREMWKVITSKEQRHYLLKELQNIPNFPDNILVDTGILYP